MSPHERAVWELLIGGYCAIVMVVMTATYAYIWWRTHRMSQRSVQAALTGTYKRLPESIHTHGDVWAGSVLWPLWLLMEVGRAISYISNKPL